LEKVGAGKNLAGTEKGWIWGVEKNK